MYKVNQEIARDILTRLPENKRNALYNACGRNFDLTSSWGLENMTMTVYKEGFKLQLDGCRSSWSVYAQDNDGELEIVRKPVESKLHKLYEDWAKTDKVVDLSEMFS